MTSGLCRRTAIRAGGEAYAREHGTRGATTLLKSNVTLTAGLVTLIPEGGESKCLVYNPNNNRSGGSWLPPHS